MTKREKILASAVVLVLGLFAVQYMVNSILGGLRDKQAAVDAARGRSADMDKLITDGKIAARALEDLAQRSLPRDEQILVSRYRDWLTDLGHSVELQEVEVTVPDRPLRTTNAYAVYKFSLHGVCRLDKMLELLGHFYDQNYLHTISNFSFDWIDARTVKLHLESTALALQHAAPDQPPPTGSSGRLEMPVEEYQRIILDRNPFFPPNAPPRMSLASTVSIERGKPWQLPLDSQVEDPEKNNVRVELVSTELPPGLQLRGNTLEWVPQENGEYEIVVRAEDDGWPRRWTEQKLVLQVVDPRVEQVAEPEPEPPKFDPASQTYVSAVLGGRSGPEVWIRSRIDGKTLKLRVGDEFEVGSVRAKVVDINLRENYIELESDSMRWTVDMDTPLSVAFERALVD
ncbi:MAG: hypothetical protein D6753_06900 [Planctomycetota bacterium]|nr:MAG: hypothetical protein D6753_06900 [Planctomycetota bacterium]